MTKSYIEINFRRNSNRGESARLNCIYELIEPIKIISRFHSYSYFCCLNTFYPNSYASVYILDNRSHKIKHKCIYIYIYSRSFVNDESGIMAEKNSSIENDEKNLNYKDRI